MPCDGLHAAMHLGDDGIAIVGEQDALVALLAAGVGVEAGVIEDDFDFVAWACGGDAGAGFDECKDFAVGGGELCVALEDGLGEVAVEGGGGLFRAAFPGGAGAGLFFGAGLFKAGEVEA